MSTPQPPGSRAPAAPVAGAGGGAASQVGRAAGLLGALVATSVVAGLVVAGIALPGVVAAGRATSGTVELFNELPAELAEQPLSQQSRILFADGSLMATFYYQNRIVVGLDQMAPAVREAIVAVEDSRFYEHGGVDPEGIGRAAINNAASDGTQGASTLTQQWIKNVLLDNAIAALPAGATDDERNAAIASATASQGTAGYARKLREIKLAIAAEKEFSKDEILERYLNIANFGDGEYGVQTAARHYFDKDAGELTVADAATLAGIVQRPGAFNPRTNPEQSQARRDVVLGRMLAQGKIDQATHDEAVNTPIADQLSIRESPNGCTMALGSAYFCDYAVRNLLNDPIFAPTFEERRQRLYRGGLSITTTLEPGKQRAAEATLKDRVEGDGGVSGTIVSIEPGTGRVVAMAQNSIYNTSADAPPGATVLNFNVDKQSGGGNGFQPGSNFKPIVLATWLENDKKLLQSVNSQKKTFANSSWKYGSCFGAGDGRYTSDPYGPANAGDSVSKPSMSVLEATYNSVNTAYAQMENQLQLCDVQNMASRLGVVNAATGEPVPPRPSMVLGTQEVAPLAMANMFATFGNRGTYCRPLALDRVTDAGDQEVPITQSSCREVVSPDVADGVNYTLQNVFTRGTASKVGGLSGREAAGKTGTTNESVAAWFTGYTPNLATSVWLGYATGGTNPVTGRPGLEGALIGGKRYPKMYGGTLAAPIWKQYMQDATEGMASPDFTTPPQRIIGTPPPPPKPKFTPRPPAPTRERAPEPAPSAPAPEPPSDDGGDDDGAPVPPPAGDAGQPPAGP